MRCGELCNRTVVIAHAHDGLVESVRRMRTQNVGSLVIVEERGEGRVPVGIVTDRDLLFVLVDADLQRVPALRLADVPRRELVVARDDEDASGALVRMRAQAIRRLPVVDARGVLEGILTYDDLVEWLAEELGDLGKLVQRQLRGDRADA